MLRRSLFIAATVGLLALVGCATDKVGSGDETSETREVDPFSRIVMGAEAEVVVTVGHEQQVIVRGDDNLVGDVGTAVEGDTLEISQPDSVDFEPKAGLVVEISMPELAAVEVSGAGNMSMEGVEGDSFRAEVSGAGNLQATGRVDRVEAEVSGAGDVDFAQLLARDATVEISGAGDIHVHATESLSASVSGAGDVTYTGDPSDVQTDVSGAGDIHPG
jgi:hypothetical protein